ncbi:hypothetical protein QCA50_018899 [Cerrena zonata]|uniref:HMG box domain-containing protein n=1 Tax=Cerrena zonata TaxID=2478898 RepID=A0AAW0FL99_9APHY
MRSDQINTALPERTPKYMSAQLSKMVSVEWKPLTLEQKKVVTAEAKPNVEKRCKSRLLGSHSVPIASFQDFHKTMESITKQLLQLKQRTGVEVALFACRSSSDAYERPFHYSTALDHSPNFGLHKSKVKFYKKSLTKYDF